MNGKTAPQHKVSAGTLSKAKLMAMLRMQAEMNAKVNLDWLTAGYPWLRAAMVEGAEAMEHAGWKWWKAQTRDVEQLRMELVDIWHFAMSDAIIKACGVAEVVAEWLLWDLDDVGRDHVAFNGLDYFLSDMDTLSRIDLLIGLAAARHFDTALFESLIEDSGMTWDDLYRAYVGKNVLNFFRQDHGYKDGTYQKVWAGREDNEHLTEILAAADPEAPDFSEQVYWQLSDRYAVLTEA